jgi:non-heme chloroperoxidase
MTVASQAIPDSRFVNRESQIPHHQSVASAFSRKDVTLSSGITLEYVRRGDTSGVPVIFVHGVTDSWRSFEWMLPSLPPAINAYAISVRGHGGSDRPAQGYDTHDFARDVDGFMDRLSIPSAVVVGHSMGSGIALRLALDYPSRTRALVLIGGMAAWGANPAVREVAATVAGFTGPIDPAFVRDFQLSTVATDVPAIIKVAVEESLRVPLRVWKDAFAGILQSDVSRELPRITVPTLVMWGGKETFATFSEQKELARGIQGARLLVYEHAGHALHWDEPRRVARDIAAFVGEL